MKSSFFAIALSIAAFAVLPLSGQDFKILDMTKGIYKDGQLPVNFVSYGQADYKPLPVVSYKVEEGKKAWVITKVEGKAGARFDSYRRYPAKAGDKFILTVEAKGKGEGFFMLQVNSQKGWEGQIGYKSFKVTDKYAIYNVEFDVKDMNNPTRDLYCHFIVQKGSELYIRSINGKVVPGKVK